jgi:putative transposase
MPRVPYPTDLRDAEWAILEPLLPLPKSLGRPRADLRAVLNAIRYVQQAWPYDGQGWLRTP